MRNIKLTIEYDGTNYFGWQTQRDKRTVQETIEKALKKLFKENIKIAGSGRTDAGVHATGQAANFKIRHSISADNLQKALNSNLPKDIVIIDVKEAGRNFHSRFNAKSKVYRYTILNRIYPSALLRDKVYFYPHALSINLMRRQARYFLGKHDFKPFCNSRSGVKDTARTVKLINIKRDKQGFIRIDIEADGFLYNMARKIVGTLIEAGRGKKNMDKAGPTAPAKGLCLLEVKY